MKTDRFDEEFRRKLQDLPADADKTDVERTYAYVRTNNPVAYGVGWSNWLLFGVGGLLLLGSLLYNGIQYARTTQLQTSVDSLSHKSTRQVVRPGAVQHDTIYLTRSEKTGPFSSSASPDGYQERAAESAVKPSATFPPVHQPVDKVASGEIRLVSRAGQQGRVVPTTPPGPLRPTEMPTDADPSMQPLTPLAESVDAVGRDLSNAPSLNRSPRSGAKTSQPATTPLSDSGTDVVEPFADSKSKNRQSVVTTRSARRRTSGQVNRLVIEGRQDGAATISMVNSTGYNVTAEASRPVITAEPLATRPLHLADGSPGSRLASRSLTAPKTELAGTIKTTKQPWHPTMPRLSVPNAQYRVGTGWLGGPDQLSGALLGELQINRHWSVQTGVQVSLADGFHYRDEQDFVRHRNLDFRQTYGVQAPSSADIEDINLRSTLIQLPVQVAYHYPLGRQWGLRLGLGTELTLALRSTVGYDYRQNNRSNEYELMVNSESTRVFNNLTIGTSLERAWKRWQFRAGPFISPQLRPVSYRSDDLMWGGTVQVFYRLGK